MIMFIYFVFTTYRKKPSQLIDISYMNCIFFVLAKTIFVSLTATIETRYTVNTYPFIETFVMLCLFNKINNRNIKNIYKK